MCTCRTHAHTHDEAEFCETCAARETRLGRLPRPSGAGARARVRVITCTVHYTPRHGRTRSIRYIIYARRVRVRARRGNATRNRLRADRARGGGGGGGVGVVAISHKPTTPPRAGRERGSRRGAGGWASDRRWPGRTTEPRACTPHIAADGRARWCVYNNIM